MVFLMLFMATFGIYHQMQYGTSIRRKKVPSPIDKEAFGEYYLKKLAHSTVQDNDSRARSNRWFSHFKKYLTMYKQ